MTLQGFDSKGAACDSRERRARRGVDKEKKTEAHERRKKDREKCEVVDDEPLWLKWLHRDLRFYPPASLQVQRRCGHVRCNIALPFVTYRPHTPKRGQELLSSPRHTCCRPYKGAVRRGRGGGLHPNGTSVAYKGFPAQRATLNVTWPQARCF